MTKEYVGYLTEKEVNTQGELEEICAVRGEMTVDINSEEAFKLLCDSDTAP